MNNSYWKRQSIELIKDINTLCSIIYDEYPEDDDRYILAKDIQNKQRASSLKTGCINYDSTG